MNKGFTSLLPSNIENEEKFLAYVINNPDKLYSIDVQHLYNNTHKAIYKAIEFIIDNSLTVECDLIYSKTKEMIPSFEKTFLTRLKRIYRDFSNIDYVIRTIKNYAVTCQIGESLNEISVTLLETGDLNKAKLSEIADKLSSDSFLLQDEQNLKNGNQLMDDYERVLEKRRLGEDKKSLGFDSLNQAVARPGAIGEMTAIVGQKGSGKSIFVKNIENRLLPLKTCVVSVNLEMEQNSNMDRLICAKMGLSISQLTNPNMDEKVQIKVKQAIRRIRSYNNYAYYSKPQLSLYELDGLLGEAKRGFKESGVLPEDEYMFVVIDLLDMMDDFDGADPYKIKTNMNRLHRIARKHRCHILIVLQASENKWRKNGGFKKPEDLDYYKIGLEDIADGAGYAQRCRVVMSLNRPVQMKKQFFPERIEEWELEPDIINVHGIKHNDGNLFFSQFAFGENFKILEYMSYNIEEEEE